MPNPTSNVPLPAWNPQIGFITPDETAILAGVKQDINGAFGGGLNMVNDTPQGQLSVSETAIIGYINDTFIFYQNMVDPAYSKGRMHDAIGRIYFIERDPPRPTTVQCELIGLPGVVVPVDTICADTAGSRYTNLQTVVIGANGLVTTTFANMVTGPIPCPAGSLIGITQAIPGWDRISNPGDGLLGRNTETDAEFEYRRSISTAWNAMGSMPCILGSVLQVAGVTDAYVTENVEMRGVTIGGAYLQPKSIYVAVVGGTAEDIARAIWTKKAPGCAYNGNTSVMIYDTSNGYRPPYPAYPVCFTRPDSLEILIQVTLQDTIVVPATALGLIQTAIINAFAGADGGARCTIGQTVYASRFYCPVRDALPDGVKIINIKVGASNMASAIFKGRVDDGTVANWDVTGAQWDTTVQWDAQQPQQGTVLTVEELYVGELAPGQNINGNSVNATTIVSQKSGTPGGVGQYVVSQQQLTPISDVMYGMVVNLDEIPVNINQMPSTDIEDISLILVK